MRCWHIHRPMTPVPTHPTRVLPGSALLTAIVALPVIGSSVVDLDDPRGGAGPRQTPARPEFPRAFTRRSPIIHPSVLSDKEGEGGMIVPRLRAPIVLVHGLFGFAEVRVGPKVLASYFHGIPEALRAPGNAVHVARLSPTRGVAARAGQLRDFLERVSPREPVHLFGHSMGGLDARYMISRLGMADRVLSLTTLGTPHAGSPFADWALRRLGRLVCPVLNFLGLPHEALQDLTVARCAEFNAQTPDAPSVRYFAVAGRYES